MSQSANATEQIHGNYGFSRICTHDMQCPPVRILCLIHVLLQNVFRFPS